MLFGQEFVDYIRQKNKKERETSIMTLGEFIDRLKEFDYSDLITIEPFGLAPDEFMSYRGFYEDLSLTYKENCSETVGNILKKAKDCIGKSFSGYKGGEFTMDENTVLWCSEYGRVSEMAVIDIVKNKDGNVQIICERKEV